MPFGHSVHVVERRTAREREALHSYNRLYAASLVNNSPNQLVSKKLIFFASVDVLASHIIYQLLLYVRSSSWVSVTDYDIHGRAKCLSFFLKIEMKLKILLLQYSLSCAQMQWQ